MGATKDVKMAPEQLSEPEAGSAYPLAPSDQPSPDFGQDWPVLGGSEIRTSREVDQLIPALVEAQKAMGVIERDVEVTVKTKAGKTYKYRYATLAKLFAETLTHLNTNGIAVIQGTSNNGAEMTVATRLFHVSGQWSETSMTLRADDDYPKALGSAVTYGRRYTYELSIAVAATEDDDGQRAQRRSEEQAERGPEAEPSGGGHANALRKFHARFEPILNAVEEGIEEGGGLSDNEEHELRAVVIRTYTDEAAESAKDCSPGVLDVISDELRDKHAEIVKWLSGQLAKMRTPGPAPNDIVREEEEAKGPTVCAEDGCEAELSAGDIEKSKMVGLAGGYCMLHRGDAVTAMMKAKKIEPVESTPVEEELGGSSGSPA